jgi:hypothetical protein
MGVFRSLGALGRALGKRAMYTVHIVPDTIFPWFFAVLRIRDPGSGAFLTIDPESGIFSGSRIPNPYF